MINRIKLLMSVSAGVFLLACASQPGAVPKSDTAYVVVKFNSAEQVKSLNAANADSLRSTNAELQSVLKAVGATRWEPLQKAKFKNQALAEKMGMNRLGRLYFKNNKDATEVIDALRQSGMVEYAEQDREAHINDKQKETN